MTPHSSAVPRLAMLNRRNSRRISRLVLHRQLDVNYDRMLFPVSGVGYEKIRNFLLSRFEAFLRVKTPNSYPIGLQLEPTIDCQLKCSLCPRLLVKSTGGT